MIFRSEQGIALKKINMPSKKADSLNSRNENYEYKNRTKELILKDSRINPDLDLVIEFLNDIISFI